MAAASAGGGGRHYFVDGKASHEDTDGAAGGWGPTRPPPSGWGPSRPAGVAGDRAQPYVETSESAAALRRVVEGLDRSSCVRIFVAGAVTHVGKTTVCLSILAALRKAGLQASELAYIKPATQCEAPDLLQKWTSMEGIEYVSGESAPLVFYSGFTRAFLEGEQGTSEQWLEKITRRIDELAVGRRVLIVDGVGFPAVGSIVGVDNADVAIAARAPVLLVCKSGVGGAIDSFSLNSSYFIAKGVPVLGALFNFGETDGFYSWEKCIPSLRRWFDSRGSRRERYYGLVPKTASLDGLREKITDTAGDQLEELATLNASHFEAHVDLAQILTDASADDVWSASAKPASIGSFISAAGQLLGCSKRQEPLAASTAAASLPPKTAAGGQPLSREEVQAKAAAAGSKGGG